MDDTPSSERESPSKAETKDWSKTAGAEKSASKGEKAVARVPAIVERPQASIFRGFFRELIWITPSWLVSMLVHVIVLLLLAMVYLPPAVTDDLRQLIASPGETEELEELDEFENEPPDKINLVTTDVLMLESPVETGEIAIADFDEPAAVVAVELNDFGLEHAPRSDLLAAVGAYSGDALAGRGSGKQRLVVRGGGSEASERAVAMGLEWLANHQFADGSWSFNHAACPKCRGQCRNPGELHNDARNGATAMALLPFLGAGQTHKEGKYKAQVKEGLYYLIRHMRVSLQGGSLYDPGGRMYSHGLGSIVLCEAYGMTHDKNLYDPAQQAIFFICYAQDPIGGGWRYEPRQPGDTSVVGWQIMALKSGHMAYLHVPPITVRKAYKYLDIVQANRGANYGYIDPGSGQATTAIGLLCRMYLGWQKEEPALVRGVEWISMLGPSKTNAYYNYYATQVMRHYGGDRWKKWNDVMREQLIKSQATKGHEKGSWVVPGQGLTNAKGGRLYETAMSTMILEVYYRHLPIYRKQSTEQDFPLD